MPDPIVKSPVLTICNSAPHRAILGLMPVALGHPCPAGLWDDLKASKPEDLVSIATYNYVHTVLASAFNTAPELRTAIPRDLDVFFVEMQAANIRRNDAFRDQLKTIGEALARHNIEAVVLKGGAELIAPLQSNPGFRFVSDLDLLVGEADIEAAATVLQGIGAQISKNPEINQRGHHHLPQMMVPDWAGPVELHRRIGTGVIDRILPAKSLLEASSSSQYAGIRLPGPCHRLAHLVLHAQLSTPRYERKILSLRDCLEFEQMTGKFPGAIEASARALFEKHQADGAFDALKSVTDHVVRPDQGTRRNTPAERWARQALKGFGQPWRQRITTNTRLFIWRLWRFLTNPERRRYYLKIVANREEREQFRARDLDRNRRIK